MKDHFVVPLFACYVILSLKCVLVTPQGCSSKYLNAATYSSVLTSPNYPAYYPSAITCEWKITAPSSFYRVQLDFSSFTTYSFSFLGTCSSYSSDYLQIYDASYASSSRVLGKYCGSYLPATVISSGQYLYLKFSSRNYQPRKGYKLQYKAVRVPSGISSTCSPFNSDITNSNLKLTSTSSSKYIESPLYPSKYPSKIQCTWYITASSSSKRIKMTLAEVKLSSYSSTSCGLSSTTQDSLTIRDGSSSYSKALKTVCQAQSSPITVISSGRYMTVKFSSNEDNYFPSSTARFKLQYREISTTTGSSVCSPTNSYIRVKAYSNSQYIMSPWYPNQYPSNIQCTWYITASSSSRRIELTLSDVKIYNQYYYSCSKYSSNDFLTIRDGSSISSRELKTVCSSQSSKTTVRSSGRYMTIQFKTDSTYYFKNGTAGFKLEYHEYEPDSSNVGMIVGIVIAVIVAIGLITCCVCIAKKKTNPGNVHRVPAAATIQTTTTTHAPPSSAPQYPMQVQCKPSYPTPAGNYPPPGQGSYPPPGQGNYPPPGPGNYLPPGQGSYPPPPPGQGSFPTPVQFPPPGSYPPAQGSNLPPGQGGYPPPGQGSYPPPGSYPPSAQGSNPPPGQGGYPPPAGYPAYPPVGYPPPVEAPVPNEPPPQYPGISADPSQPAYNPQYQGPSQSNPQYPPGNAPYPATQDTKAGGPPQF